MLYYQLPQLAGVGLVSGMEVCYQIRSDCDAMGQYSMRAARQGRQGCWSTQCGHCAARAGSKGMLYRYKTHVRLHI